MKRLIMPSDRSVSRKTFSGVMRLSNRDMNVNRSQITSWLLISSISLLLVISCGVGSRRVKIGEQFTLRPGEGVVVEGTGLKIQVDGVGHQTAPNPQPKGFRASYVEMTITVGDAPPRAISVDNEVNISDYTITVKSANPFRSDDGPRCELVVTRR